MKTLNSERLFLGFRSTIQQFHIKKKGLQSLHAKKVVSDSPGLVDFANGLVIFVLNLPNGQVLFFGDIQVTEGL